MLKIRLSRIGKPHTPAFRITVGEQRISPKRYILENLGIYNPKRQPPELTLKKERIEYWLSKGAQPSATLATLLKQEGFPRMDVFLRGITHKAKKKREEKEAAKAAAGGEVKPAAKEVKKDEAKPAEKAS